MDLYELGQILCTYKWIKVPKYNKVDGDADPFEYDELYEHHVKETEFLIAKVRELAQRVFDLEHE